MDVVLDPPVLRYPDPKMVEVDRLFIVGLSSIKNVFTPDRVLRRKGCYRYGRSEESGSESGTSKTFSGRV